LLKLCKWPVIGDSKNVHNAWNLSGKLESGGDFRLRLSDTEVVLTAPVGDVKWNIKESFDQSQTPVGGNEMLARLRLDLPVLYMWRQLAVDHGKSFTEFYYQGTAPFAGSEKWYDVLIAKHDARGVECWFYIDPSNGQMVGMEMYSDDHSEPCELSFSQYREIDGHFLPSKIEVRAGDDLFATLNVDAFALQEGPSK